MFTLKYSFVTLFIITTATCFINVTEDKSNNSIIELNSTVQPSTVPPTRTNTIESPSSTSSGQQIIDRNVDIKKRFRKSVLIVSHIDEFGPPRRNWNKGQKGKGRMRGRPRRRPIGRAGQRQRIADGRHTRNKTKRINKIPKILWYQEYDDLGNLVANETLKSLEDVVKFFHVYLGVHLCYEKCDDLILPGDNASLSLVTGKNMYYEFKVFLPNGSYSVLETSTKWLP